MDIVSFELGAIITFLTDKLIGLLGPDERKKEFQQRLIQRIRISSQDASTVQCIGMSEPIPITDIYQPTRFFPSSRDITPIQLPLPSESAIIFAGPGRGKTTLLNWLYIQLAITKQALPLLFYLREPTAVEDLQYLIERIAEAKRGEERKKIQNMLGEMESGRIVLLVDGYDEISEAQRQVVSEYLKLYSGLNCGVYILTCRSFYVVYSLKAKHYHLAPFSNQDAERFIQSFSEAYGSPVDAKSLLADLQARGFIDFATHPLMLTLVCILKTSRMPNLPRNPISLIRRALEILTFKWDEEKGIYRDSKIPLDGDERLRCLMRIAYFMEIDQAAETEVEAIVNGYLRLVQTDSISSRELLKEIVQWFGVIYQDSESNWRFTHKTIHDYLAARFWVESAAFTPSQVKKWNARAGYAACLVPDATQSLSYSLRFSEDMSAFIEALANNPSFEVNQIASVVREHFEKTSFHYDRLNSVISIRTDKDFFSFASDKFIVALITAGAKWEGPSADLLVSYGLSEWLRRRQAITEDLSGVLRKRFLAYPLENIGFRVRRSDGWHSFTLQEVLSTIVAPPPGVPDDRLC